MKHRIVAVALFALVVTPGAGFAQLDGQDQSKTVNPGSVRITTRAPEPEKWTSIKNKNGSQRVFKCKPLACADTQTVSFTFLKSPTNKPNPAALDKFAKVDLPKSIRAAGAAREVLSDGAEKVDTVSSETTTMKGYPSVINETKITRSGNATYLEIAIIFAGPVMIRVHSSSPNQELAKKALTEFIEIMQIAEGPPLQPDLLKPRPNPQGTRSL